MPCGFRRFPEEVSEISGLADRIRAREWMAMKEGGRARSRKYPVIIRSATGVSGEGRQSVPCLCFSASGPASHNSRNRRNLPNHCSGRHRAGRSQYRKNRFGFGERICGAQRNVCVQHRTGRVAAARLRGRLWHRISGRREVRDANNSHALCARSTRSGNF